MEKLFHKRPYLATFGLIALICGVMLFFLNAIAYAQNIQTPAPEPSHAEHIIKLGTYVALGISALGFSVGYVFSLWRKYRIAEEKEAGETWKKLADSRKEENAELKAEVAQYVLSDKTLRERLKKQKKLTLRLIARIEGDGTEFDEETEEV